MQERARTLAIDIPSGVDGATGEITGARSRRRDDHVRRGKPGLLFEPGRGRAGRVTVADIGIELGTVSLFVPDVGDLRLPRRNASAHKWSSGLMVFGGSNGLTGAPLMAARAGARTGAGIVVCSLPGHEAAAAASGAEIVTRAMPATEAGDMAEDAARVALKDITRFQALAIGPASAATTARAAAAGWSPGRPSPSSSTPTR